ncbi:MAG TPA: DUF6799 domain-containing protein [Bacteroidia bacterium]|jgi:hypothetical protein|nr:DUF6799 domain-containing protein [Bacteroidia bacterium]
MKATYLFIAAGLLALNLSAGNGVKATSAVHGDKYCVKLKDGRLVTMHEGSEITADVTLANGTQVKTDGTVIKKDGTKVVLREGECVDKDGKVMRGKEKIEKKNP